MSNEAQALVWKRARAKGSNLLVLVKLADCAGDDGRDAWPGPKTLARWCRLTDRGLRYILHRLERAGEIVIDRNEDGRFVMIGRRKFQPEWFLHIRCVYDWDAYQLDDQEAIFSSSDFQTGRRPAPRESEKFSDQGASTIGKDFSESGTGVPGNRKNHVAHIRKDLLVDPLVEQEQGAARPFGSSNGRRTDDDPHYPVILKTAHDAVDLDGVEASLGQLAATTKSLCKIRRLNVGDNSELIAKAVDAALFQRTHPRGAH